METESEPLTLNETLSTVFDEDGSFMTSFCSSNTGSPVRVENVDDDEAEYLIEIPRASPHSARVPNPDLSTFFQPIRENDADERIGKPNEQLRDKTFSNDNIEDHSPEEYETSYNRPKNGGTRNLQVRDRTSHRDGQNIFNDQSIYETDDTNINQRNGKPNELPGKTLSEDNMEDHSPSLHLYLSFSSDSETGEHETSYNRHKNRATRNLRDRNSHRDCQNIFTNDQSIYETDDTNINHTYNQKPSESQFPNDRTGDQSPPLHLYLSFSSDSETEESGNSVINNLKPKKRRKTSHADNDLLNVMTVVCCANECLQRSLSLHDVRFCRQQLRSKKEHEVKQFVMDTLINQSNVAKMGKKGTLKTTFTIQGRGICAKGWRLAYDISNWRYEDCIKRIKSGKVYANKKTSKVGNKREKTNAALAWMTILFKRMGDFQPHKDTIHLPHSWSKKHLYERMMSELRLGKENSVSYEHFTRIWKENLSQYVISKTSDFTKCATCSQLNDQYERVTQDDTRADIAKMKAEHDSHVESERRAYHEARLKARTQPSEMTCIIIDGMDQSKTNIPHFVMEDKDNAHLARLPVHFTGVLIHTASAEGKIPIIYHDIKHVPHDSNLTLHCLTEALTEVRGNLGKTLFLQLDNCGRENKNKYVFSYVALLVQMEIFKEAYIHFLPVGHTHEDIDQMFSCVARQLRCHNAFTLQDLEHQTSISYSPPIKMVPVTMVQNIKVELIKHMAGHFKNHSKPLWFRFRKSNGTTHMHYRLWCTDTWKPADDSEWPLGLQCLKTSPKLNEIVPWVETSLTKTDFERLCQEVPHAYNSRLPMEAKEWWNNFLLTQIRGKYEKIPPAKPWALQGLLTIASPDSEQRDDLECLLTLRERIVQACPEVTIGEQGKQQRGVARVSDYSSVEKGMLVAIHCEQREGRPHVGSVTAIGTDEVQVDWLRGSWTGGWHPWTIRQNGRKKPYSSVVPMKSLILWDFTLTQGGKLRKDTIRELKSKYEELDL